MKCIKTTSLFFLLVSEILGKPFWPKKGIRQDDPISSYVIIICVGCLGTYIFMINTQISKIDITDGSVIPYLMFTYECTFFIDK